MGKHQVLINALKSAESVMMNFCPDQDGGDIQSIINGYKFLCAKFEHAFGRAWEPSLEFKEWAIGQTDNIKSLVSGSSPKPENR
jgi:hypothetical protein